MRRGAEGAGVLKDEGVCAERLWGMALEGVRTPRGSGACCVGYSGNCLELGAIRERRRGVSLKEDKVSSGRAFM